jgi:hypothetical protein
MAEEEGSWNPITSQIAALGTALGFTLGALRVKEIMSEEEAEQLLDAAAEHLPAEAKEHGETLLMAVRSAMQAVE